MSLFISYPLPTLVHISPLSKSALGLISCPLLIQFSEVYKTARSEYKYQKQKQIDEYALI